MPNLNQPTRMIPGRNPLAKNNRPSFSVPQQTEAALWLSDGKINEACSGAATYTGEITESGSVLNFRLDSDKPELNALVISGGTSVLLEPNIHMSGCGCSDFTCKGAGVLTVDGAKVDIRGGEIVTHGSTRCATIATTGSTLKVFDARLATYGGPLPEGYVPVIGPGMMEPPAPLGLGGNCRTHLAMDNSESYFNNCEIYGEAWAALSTDSSGGYVYMEANDCDIRMNGNGYVIYADNGCHVVLNDCDISSGNLFAIQDGNSSIAMKNTYGICNGYGFLVHGGMHDLEDIGMISMRECGLTSEGPMFRCKSTNVNMHFNCCQLTSKEGVILQTMISDDEFYYKTRTHGDDEYGVQATFEDMEVFGDFLCGDTERKNCLNMVNTAVTGGISGFPLLQLTEGSTFTATKDSCITIIGETEGLDAAAGVTITAKGTGEDVTLPSGGILHYLGE